MKLRMIYENRITEVPIRDLIVDTQGIRESLQDIAYGRPSVTTGPVEVEVYGLRLVDGYHRVVDAILRGDMAISVVKVSAHASINRVFKFSQSRLLGLEDVIGDLDPDGKSHLDKIYGYK